MVTVNQSNALKVLQDIVKRSTGTKDGEITRGEVRRSFDSNNDGFVSHTELNKANLDLLQLAANDSSILSSVKDPDQRAQLEKAQEYLRDLLRNQGLRQAPPDSSKVNKIKNDPLIKDPYNLKDQDANIRWSKERNSFMDKRIRLDLLKEKANIQTLLKGGNTTSLIKALWTNDDAISGKKTNVLRMNELIGVWAATKNNPALRKEFTQEMAKFINDKSNGLDPQFVLDSLLQVIQSTDFTGQEDLENFLKDFAIETAKGGDFASRGDGVISNYDSSNEGGVFGSLALVKNGDKFEFVVHDPGNQARKTRYVLDNKDEALNPDNNKSTPAGPGGVSSSTTSSEPATLQNNLNEIKKDLDPLKEKVKNNPADKKKFDEAAKGLNVNIPSLIKNNDAKGLQDLIGNLKTLCELAKKYGLTDLSDKLDALIRDLQKHVETLKTSRSGGFAPGIRTNSPSSTDDTSKGTPPTTTRQTTPPTTQRKTTPPITTRQTTPPTTQRKTTTPITTRQTTPPTTQRKTTTPITIRQTPPPTTQRKTTSPATPKESTSISRNKDTTSVGRLKVRWERDRNTLIHKSSDRHGAPVTKMFKVHSAHQANGKVESKWYEIMDRDLQYPYTFQAGKGKIHYLVPYDDDSKRDFAANKLPDGVQRTLKDPQLMSHVYGSRKIITTNGYSFVNYGSNVYFSRNQLTWHSTDPNDNATYNVIQRGATVVNVEKNS